MTISEAISHQTASRPVGMPVALRVVAMGRVMARCLDPQLAAAGGGSFCGQ